MNGITQMHTSFRELGIVSMLGFLVACAGATGWTPQWGPGPSDAISASAIDRATYDAAPVSRCEGPPDEVAELGGLCSATLPGVDLVQDAGDVGFIVYPGNMHSNAIVVFGYYSTDASVGDRAADIRYAARYIADVGTAGGGSLLEKIERDVALWESGDELAGSIGTLRQLGETTCVSDIFVGVATLRWRNTTITFQFDASWPC